MLPFNFNKLYSAYYRKAFVFTKSYIYDRYAAEDIASEALIKLWELMKVEQIKQPQAMLLTILKNKSLDYLKHQRVQQKAFASIKLVDEQDLNIRISTLEACNPQEIFSAELQEIIQDTLSKLPKQTIQVFQMSRYDHLSNKEIADQLNISVKGVEYHINKSLKMMRVALKDYLHLFTFIW